MRNRRWTRHRPLFASPSPRAVKKPKIKWKILPIFWLAFKRVSFMIGASVLLSALVGVYVAGSISKPVIPTLPHEMVLFYTFDGSLQDVAPEAHFTDPFAPVPLTVRQLTAALDKAAVDPHVKGFLARLDGGGFSLAHVQEVRAAVKRFRNSGKFAYIYSPSYGEMGGGLSGFYLASAFEARWMQPMGIVDIGGVKAEVPYAKEMLDKIGVEPDFFQRKEYKTAYESLGRVHISPENKQMMEDIVAGIRETILADIPGDLGLPAGRFERLVNTGLFPAQEALKEGLISQADYADVLVSRINEAITGDPETEEEIFVELSDYAAITHHTLLGPTRPQVALVYVSGIIMDEMADEIVPAIMEAAEDDAIQAIVLRVDSPGGSPVASESILRASERAQEKGKPVIVSMGQTAASGGYWVAAYADRIFALPTTLTGSIGVVGGKFALGKLWEKIGVNWDLGAQWGENSGMWSVNTKFSDSEAARINAMLDQVYDGFLARVAKGRKMSPAAVDKIARGRVWTGAQAVEIGLVDQLGGLDNALDYVAALAGAMDRQGLEIVQLPKPQTPFERLIELLGQQGAVYEGMRIQSALLAFLQPAMREFSLMQDNQALTYEPMKIEH